MEAVENADGTNESAWRQRRRARGRRSATGSAASKAAASRPRRQKAPLYGTRPHDRGLGALAQSPRRRRALAWETQRPL